MICYRIKDWDEHYENNRTRKMEVMRWVPIPNKFDGDGYTEIVDGPDGAALYGCWVAIVGVAGRCHKRGTLVRDNGTPHTAATISRLTRLPEDIIESTLKKAASAEIAWLEVIEIECDAQPWQAGATKMAGGCQPTDYRRKEEKEEGTHTTRQRPQSWPSLQQVLARGEFIGLIASEAERFWNHFESTAWNDKNGHPIHNWQSKLAMWKSDFEAKENEKKAKASNLRPGATRARPPTIHEIRAVKEAKEARMADLKRKFYDDLGLNSGWNNEEARREHIGLKKEVKELNEKLANAL